MSDPFVGKVPAFHPIVNISFATVVVNSGKVPTAVIEFTVVIPPAVDTEIVGAATLPAGVYVDSPDCAGATVAVLFSVVSVVTLTVPLGVNFPLDVKLLPVNVG